MRATIYDVARLAGVSSSMASRVLLGRRKRQDEVTSRVKDAASTLGYHPNRVASSLRTTSSGLIGLVIPELRNPYFSSYAEALSRQALINNFVVMSVVARDSDALSAVQRLMEYRARAIVSAVPAVTDAMKHMGWDGLLIAVSRQPHESQIPYVGMDDYQAGYLVGRELYKLGHETVVVFAESMDIPSTSPRLDGIRNALGPSTSLTVKTTDGVDDVTVAEVQHVYQQTRASAFVACADAIAIRLYNALGQSGLRVPADVSLISFDGTFASVDLVPIPLTTVVQPIDACVTRVVEWISTDISPSALTQPLFLPPSFRSGATTRNVKGDKHRIKTPTP